MNNISLRRLATKPNNDTARSTRPTHGERASGLKVLTAATLVASMLTSAPTAFAQSKGLPLWEIGVGGTAFAQPDYPGSDETRIRGVGFPWFIYRGQRLKLTRNAVQGRIFKSDRVRLDISANGQLPVDSDENDARRGMPDLDWRAQMGPNLRISLAKSEDSRDTLGLDLPVRAVIAVDTDEISYQGITSSPKLRYQARRGAWRLETQFGLEFADGKYHDYVYSVDERFATADRAAYDADPGFAGTRAAAGGGRYWGDFYVGLFVNYTNLEGATFRDSPLVDTRHAVTGGVAFAWIPWKSETLATTRSKSKNGSKAGSAPTEDETLGDR